MAEKLNLPIIVESLQERSPNGDSWEESARKFRKKIFARELKRVGAEKGCAQTFVFTAHHGDDLAETMLWRLFTGTADTHGAGILFQDENEIRPFLSTRKADLVAYLKEEGLTWREDQTNHEGRFLRSKMRKDLMPVIESIFPKAISRLISRGLVLNREGGALTSQIGPEILFRAEGIAARRVHWDAIQKLRQDKNRSEIHLPQGWRLKRELTQAKSSPSFEKRPNERIERWTLERTLGKEGKTYSS